MVVTAKPFARDDEPVLLEARNPELETSEDIDPSLEVVSRPRARNEAQQRFMLSGSTRAHWTQNFLLATNL
jgi:hypothetical protein